MATADPLTAEAEPHHLAAADDDFQQIAEDAPTDFLTDGLHHLTTRSQEPDNGHLEATTSRQGPQNFQAQEAGQQKVSGRGQNGAAARSGVSENGDASRNSKHQSMLSAINGSIRDAFKGKVPRTTEDGECHGSQVRQTITCVRLSTKVKYIDT